MRRFLLLVLLAAPLAAQNVIDETIATLLRVQTFDHVTIAPDASHVAYIKTTGETKRLYVDQKQVGGTHDPTGMAWSPDSKHLAFTSDQLYVDERAITTVKGALSMPQWSPDGKSIAFLFIENASRRGGALEAMTPPAGDVETQVEEQRIAIVDVERRPSSAADDARGRASLHFATPADMYVYDYDWSPDSRSIVAEATFGSGEANYWIAQVWRFDRGDAKGRPLYKPALQIANPRWSPDGQSIAFIEGLMSDEGVTGGDVFVVPANGGAATNLTSGMHATATSLGWLSPTSILIGENVNGLSGFASVSTSGNVQQLWSGEGRISTQFVIGVSVAADGKTTAAIRDSFQHAPEVVKGPIGAWQPVTHANDSVQPLWGSARNLNWTSDGYRVQGWLLFPRDGNRKNRMVVQVHGGPSSGVVSSWPALNTAALVASGYTVLMPNPRGSYGQGESFTQANVKDFGYGDLRDVLRGVDAAVASAGMDKDRVGIWGWSYGGYMTMWSVTQTHRFRAAVAGAGVANWQSYYGQNAIDEWMPPFFGASVYEDPFIYRRSSPIEFIRNVTTPTLVLVGDRDGEVPAPQSFEFWRALRTLGVKTKLIVYPNEGHRISRPEHRRDLARRIVMWFDENL